MSDRSNSKLTARALATRLTPQSAPRGRLVARLALCAALAGGATAVAGEPDAWAAGESSSDSPEQAFQNGLNDGVNAFNANGQVPSVGIAPAAYTDNPALANAWGEGYFTGAQCAASGDGCPDACGCATCSSGCGCGCGS
jgi:hypothetical protein